MFWILIRSLILGSRPKTLVATLIPISMASCYVWSSIQTIPYLVLFIILLSGLLIQIGTNYANDYYDNVRGGDTENRLGPQRFSRLGQLPKSFMKWAAWCCFLFAFFLGLYLVWIGGIWILIIGLFSIFFGYAYTGGPYPLAYNGLGDVFVVLFFGPIAYCTTVYLLMFSIPIQVMITGFIPGLLAVGLLIINNLRDQAEDISTGKTTLVVKYGRRFGLIEYFLSILMVSICLLFSIDNVVLSSIAFVVSFASGCYLLVSLINQPCHTYNALLAKHGLWSLGTSILYCSFILL